MDRYPPEHCHAEDVGRNEGHRSLPDCVEKGEKFLRITVIHGINAVLDSVGDSDIKDRRELYCQFTCFLILDFHSLDAIAKAQCARIGHAALHFRSFKRHLADGPEACQHLRSANYLAALPLTSTTKVSSASHASSPSTNAFAWTFAMPNLAL
jgi:hypothetical protein